MEVINIEKLAGSKVIVMTGRIEHILAVAMSLVSDTCHGVFCYPEEDDYFMDYPNIVRDVNYPSPKGKWACNYPVVRTE